MFLEESMLKECVALLRVTFKSFDQIWLKYLVKKVRSKFICNANLTKGF